MTPPNIIGQFFVEQDALARKYFALLVYGRAWTLFGSKKNPTPEKYVKSRRIPHLSAASNQAGGPSFFPKETVQQSPIDKLYSGKAGLEAVHRIGDAPGRSPDVHCGCRSD